MYGHDKSTEFKENVKNSVNAWYLEEENERCGSPQWVPRYNSDINHTGEQPLIVQHFLSGNKVCISLCSPRCASSILRSLPEIGGDCFGPRYFSLVAYVLDQGIFYL